MNTCISTYKKMEKSFNKTVSKIRLYQPFTPLILISTNQRQTAFENIVGKEEIARN